jgi:hypothetical protein
MSKNIVKGKSFNFAVRIVKYLNSYCEVEPL